MHVPHDDGATVFSRLIGMTEKRTSRNKPFPSSHLPLPHFLHLEYFPVCNQLHDSIQFPITFSAVRFFFVFWTDVSGSFNQSVFIRSSTWSSKSCRFYFIQSAVSVILCMSRCLLSSVSSSFVYYPS